MPLANDMNATPKVKNIIITSFYIILSVLPKGGFIMQICYMKYKESRYNLDKRIGTNQEPDLKFKITDSRRFMAKCSAIIGICLTNIQTCQASTGITAKIDAKGWELFGITRGLAFWVAVLFMVIDIVKSVKKEDVSGIVRICIKYSAWYFTIWHAPDIVMILINLFN